MSTRTRTALALAAALVAGGAFYASQATATPAVTTLTSAAGASTASTSLDPALAAKLVALVDEERMAHDLYQLFSDRYDGARPFSMIVRSETQHTAAVRSLLATYGIADPTTTLPAGTYATPAIQALYDQWKAAGLVSVEAAERVGVDLETRDIADLEAALVGVKQADIRRVLENLIAASEHHLRAYLAAEGFLVQEAATGAQALHLLATEPADLVLLDIGLPDIDGLEVLRTLRKTSDVYVVLVTARAEEIDTILGLGVGADDYVTKPFSPREVVARVKAVLRRGRSDAPTGSVAGAAGSAAAGAGGAARSTADPDVLLFDRVSVDIARREARVDGIPAVLTALEFDLLVALAGSPGRVFSRAQLLEKVWGYDFFGDERVVDVHIRGMRKALGDDAAAPRIIGTVRSVGYKFLLDPVEGPGPGGGAS